MPGDAMTFPGVRYEHDKLGLGRTFDLRDRVPRVAPIREETHDPEAALVRIDTDEETSNHPTHVRRAYQEDAEGRGVERSSTRIPITGTPNTMAATPQKILCGNSGLNVAFMPKSAGASLGYRETIR